MGLGAINNQRRRGPLVVWNIINKCNLKCRHCYRNSKITDSEISLSDEKSIRMIDEIKNLRPPMVILSGGEPLLRKNVFEIVKKCKQAGLKVGLSTNGTLIDENMANRIKKGGVDYVGISIDGRKIFHDKFRRLNGAFALSWRAIGYLNNLGVKTGVRFTLTNENKDDLFYILDKTFKSGAKRFCLYHLVYCGRASMAMDIPPPEKRKIMEDFFSKTEALSSINEDFEVLTADNPADAIFMMEASAKNKKVINRIKGMGGCSAGERLIYIDSSGKVYPCQFLRNEPLGNVMRKSIPDIWKNKNNLFLKSLRNKSRFLKGRCGICAYKEMCNGCRARAKSSHGSLWGEDPACYLNSIQ